MKRIKQILSASHNCIGAAMANTLCFGAAALGELADACARLRERSTKETQ